MHAVKQATMCLRHYCAAATPESPLQHTVTSISQTSSRRVAETENFVSKNKIL